MARHLRQAEALDLAFFEGEADESAAVFCHEVDGGSIAEFGGDDEVALVLAVFVIDKDDHFTGGGIGEDSFDRGDFGGHTRASFSRAA